MVQIPGTPPPCAICAKPRDRHEAARGETCSARSCQTALIQRKKRAEHQAFQAECDTIAAAFAETVSAPGAIAQRVPYFPREIVPLPDEDRRAFRTRMRSAFREAFRDAVRGDTVMDEGEEPDPSPLTLNATCIACRGFCCRQGAGHAFLEAMALRAIMLRHPSQSPAQLYRFYCRAIPAQSFEVSCLYQGAQGCVLPRDRRAFICNDYECSDRTRLREALSERPDAPTLVIAMDGKVVGASAVTTRESGLEWVETER